MNSVHFIQIEITYGLIKEKSSEKSSVSSLSEENIRS